MNRAAAALVGAGCAVLAAAPAPAPAHPDHDMAFFVPGAGMVEGVDLYVILLNHLREQGCVIDFSEHETNAARARAAVARALGLTREQLPAAEAALNVAIAQTFDALVYDGVIMVNSQTGTATLAGCGLD